MPLLAILGSAEEKWVALQEWREDFKKQHNGREPKMWIDKYCIDQDNIEESLACLPVLLAGCNNFRSCVARPAFSVCGA